MGWSDQLESRRNNFDFLRFCLAAIVVYSHSFILVSGSLRTEPLTRWTHYEYSTGKLAVCFFFVISGFLIGQSWIRSKSFKDYLTKRILRIYPGFAVLTILTAFVFAPLAMPGEHYALPKIGKVLYRILILDGYELPIPRPAGAQEAFYTFPNNPEGKLNGSVWTIPYEFWCYLGLALIGAVGILARRWMVLVIFVAALLLNYWWTIRQNAPIWIDLVEHFHLSKDKTHTLAGHVTRIVGSPSEWPKFITYFLSGTLFLLYRKHIPHSNWIALVCAAALVATSQLVVATDPKAGKHSLVDLVMPIAGTYLVFWFALHPKVPFHRFGKFGDFSYGLYLYAFPIQQFCVMWFGLHGKPYLLTLISLPISIVAGMLSWFLVEKWFLRIKHRTARAVAHEESKGTQSTETPMPAMPRIAPGTPTA